MLWNQKGGKGFVCPEPQTCAVNAFKQAIPSRETGAAVLPAAAMAVIIPLMALFGGL